MNIRPYNTAFRMLRRELVQFGFALEVEHACLFGSDCQGLVAIEEACAKLVRRLLLSF